MDLTQEQQLQWNKLDLELNDWYNRVDPVLAAQMIDFQKGNPHLSEWVDNLFVPGLLGGEYGINKCLDNVVQEPDEMMRHTKFLALAAYWPHLGAPPNEVAYDLLLQGWDQESLSIYVKSRILNPTNMSEINYSGPIH